MTIALAVKVHDGVVLAADSAGTVISVDEKNGQSVFHNVYNNAHKVFNIVTGLPVGGITWGAGSIGTASIYTLVKDFRDRLADPHPDWLLDKKKYTIQDVTEKLHRFFKEKLEAEQKRNSKYQLESGGFLVSGYSTGQELAESWRITFDGGLISEPQKQPANDNREEVTYVLSYGQPEPVYRLLFGFSPLLGQGLLDAGMSDSEADRVRGCIEKLTKTALLHPAMPIQDAIDLTEFLAYVATQYSRFSPGAQGVGGPIDVAAVTKHEGFKWVKRKYYYPRELNPNFRPPQSHDH